MVSQNMVIGIAVGMFLGGLVFGYVAFMGTTHTGNMMMNNQQPMMMMSNSEYMEQLMYDPDFQRAMFEIMSSTDFMNKMMIQSGSEMGQGMMGMMNPETINQIMDDPQKKQQLMYMMKAHVSDMERLLSSSELTNEEFSEQMLQLMKQHMAGMQGLMQDMP